jgi:hypothetical protein
MQHNPQSRLAKLADIAWFVPAQFPATGRYWPVSNPVDTLHHSPRRTILIAIGQQRIKVGLEAE